MAAYIYPWQRISDDVFGPQAGHEPNALQLKESICEGFLLGKLTAVTPMGLPIKSFDLSHLEIAHVTAQDVNAWLHSQGFRLTWEPGSETACKQVTGGTTKRWTDDEIEGMIAFQENLKAKGVKNHTQQTADHYGVDTSRIGQLRRDFEKKKQEAEQFPAFSSTYKSR